MAILSKPILVPPEKRQNPLGPGFSEAQFHFSYKSLLYLKTETLTLPLEVSIFNQLIFLYDFTDNIIIQTEYRLVVAC